jgi:hypothetical protein
MIVAGGDTVVERLTIWIAWHLPKELVKWCVIRAGVHATTGQYAATVVPQIAFVDVLKRWYDD